jgi:hypothetical protein
MSTTNTYIFRIKTKSGGIVGNIVKQGTSQADAEQKLKKNYPECTILDVQIK